MVLRDNSPRRATRLRSVRKSGRAPRAALFTLTLRRDLLIPGIPQRSGPRGPYQVTSPWRNNRGRAKCQRPESVRHGEGGGWLLARSGPPPRRKRGRAAGRSAAESRLLGGLPSLSFFTHHTGSPCWVQGPSWSRGQPRAQADPLKATSRDHSRGAISPRPGPHLGGGSCLQGGCGWHAWGHSWQHVGGD